MPSKIQKWLRERLPQPQQGHTLPPGTKYRYVSRKKTHTFPQTGTASVGGRNSVASQLSPKSSAGSIAHLFSSNLFCFL